MTELSIPRPGLSRSLSAGLLTFCLLGIAAIIAWPYLVSLLQDACAATSLLPEHRCSKAPRKMLGYLATLSAFPAILMLERLWPAVRGQRAFSGGLLMDFLWFCISPLVLVLFLVPVDEALRWVYRDVLGFQSLLTLGTLPVAAQIAVAVLLSDFIQWLAHVIRHKSSIAWEFHAIHHSQTELNFFSASRLHPVDVLVTNLVRFLPFTLVDANVAVPAFIAFALFMQIYAMFTHSNIRTNLGPLKYVLVTPQSHRIHHSDRPEHQDKNFGNVFAVWDCIFGTQCRDFDSYPATGVEDRNVPRATDASIPAAVAALGRMLVYPFASLLRRGERQ